MVKFWVILLVLIAAVALFWYSGWLDAVLNQETEIIPSPQQSTISPTPTSFNGVDTTDWQIYTNQQFKFYFRYPKDWQLNEMSDSALGPVFNVYQPKGEVMLPLTHFSNITQVSVFPAGFGAEGVLSQSKEATPEFPEKIRIAQQFVLQSGEPWAVFISPKNPPATWDEAGFIWGGTQIENQGSICLHSGREIPIGECEPLSGEDEIVITGQIESQDFKIVQQILATFKFLP